MFLVCIATMGLSMKQEVKYRHYYKLLTMKESFFRKEYERAIKTSADTTLGIAGLLKSLGKCRRKYESVDI